MKDLWQALFVFITSFFIAFILFGVVVQKKVAIIYIATGRYILFWDEFYRKMEENFLPGISKHYFVFTDNKQRVMPKNVTKIYQKQMEWPGIVLRKYHFIVSIANELKKFDYTYMLNANMLPVDKIGQEIIPSEKQQLVVLQHPGYYNTNIRNYDRNSKSTAYIPHGKGKYYLAGGFVGGTSKSFLKMSEKIKQDTDTNIKNNIVAIWHDESHLNRYIVDWMDAGKTPLVLTPLYMVPQEAFHNRAYKNLNQFKKSPKMILLDKSIKSHKWWRHSGETDIKK